MSDIMTIYISMHASDYFIFYVLQAPSHMKPNKNNDTVP